MSDPTPAEAVRYVTGLEESQRRAAELAAEHADDIARLHAEEQADPESMSRPVSAEEQAAFRAQWLKGAPAPKELCGHGQPAADCGVCHDLEALRSDGTLASAWQSERRRGSGS